MGLEHFGSFSRAVLQALGRLEQHLANPKLFEAPSCAHRGGRRAPRPPDGDSGDACRRHPG
eukprot:4143576-Alexandrium_andersonii.AAC.1